MAHFSASRHMLKNHDLLRSLTDLARRNETRQKESVFAKKEIPEHRTLTSPNSSLQKSDRFFRPTLANSTGKIIIYGHILLIECWWYTTSHHGTSRLAPECLWLHQCIIRVLGGCSMGFDQTKAPFGQAFPLCIGGTLADMAILAWWDGCGVSCMMRKLLQEPVARCCCASPRHCSKRK